MPEHNDTTPSVNELHDYVVTPPSTPMGDALKPHIEIQREIASENEVLAPTLRARIEVLNAISKGRTIEVDGRTMGSVATDIARRADEDHALKPLADHLHGIIATGGYDPDVKHDDDDTQPVKRTDSQSGRSVVFTQAQSEHVVRAITEMDSDAIRAGNEEQLAQAQRLLDAWDDSSNTLKGVRTDDMEALTARINNDFDRQLKELDQSIDTMYESGDKKSVRGKRMAIARAKPQIMGALQRGRTNATQTTTRDDIPDKATERLDALEAHGMRITTSPADDTQIGQHDAKLSNESLTLIRQLASKMDSDSAQGNLSMNDEVLRQALRRYITNAQSSAEGIVVHTQDAKSFTSLKEMLKRARHQTVNMHTLTGQPSGTQLAALQVLANDMNAIEGKQARPAPKPQPKHEESTRQADPPAQPATAAAQAEREDKDKIRISFSQAESDEVNEVLTQLEDSYMDTFYDNPKMQSLSREVIAAAGQRPIGGRIDSIEVSPGAAAMLGNEMDQHITLKQDQIKDIKNEVPIDQRAAKETSQALNASRRVLSKVDKSTSGSRHQMMRDLYDSAEPAQPQPQPNTQTDTLPAVDPRPQVPDPVTLKPALPWMQAAQAQTADKPKEQTTADMKPQTADDAEQKKARKAPEAKPVVLKSALPWMSQTKMGDPTVHKPSTPTDLLRPKGMVKPGDTAKSMLRSEEFPKKETIAEAVQSQVAPVEAITDEYDPRYYTGSDFDAPWSDRFDKKKKSKHQKKNYDPPRAFADPPDNADEIEQAVIRQIRRQHPNRRFSKSPTFASLGDTDRGILRRLGSKSRRISEYLTTSKNPMYNVGYALTKIGQLTSDIANNVPGSAWQYGDMVKLIPKVDAVLRRYDARHFDMGKRGAVSWNELANIGRQLEAAGVVDTGQYSPPSPQQGRDTETDI